MTAKQAKRARYLEGRAARRAHRVTERDVANNNRIAEWNDAEREIRAMLAAIGALPKFAILRQDDNYEPVKALNLDMGPTPSAIIDAETDQWIRLTDLHNAILRPSDTGAPPPPDNPHRCALCGWGLAATVHEGCVRGNCSMRPLPSRFYAPARAKAEYAGSLDADPRCHPLTDLFASSSAGAAAPRREVDTLVDELAPALTPEQEAYLRQRMNEKRGNVNENAISHTRDTDAE